MSLFAVWTPGIPELLVILFLALLFFGKRLPEMARSMGQGVREFKDGLKEGHDKSPVDQIDLGSKEETAVRRTDQD